MRQTFHPMLFPVRDLMRREVERMDVDEPISEQIDYMRALMDLHDALMDHEQAAVLLTPGYYLRREDGGHNVYGWHHILLLPDGRKVRSHGLISVHYYRWGARWSANSWVRRARVVADRITSELADIVEAQP